MKKVIYNTCIVDPWAQVAKKLKEDFGYEPIYWIGYEGAFDNSGSVIPKMFPGIIFQPFWDAWKGNFPPEIAKLYNDSYIDIDFLKSNAFHELIAIKMMDRLDFDRYSFNFMERERHFLNFVKYWTACIKVYKPDIVISAVLPHRIYDYILYAMCKYYDIKYVCFQHTLCPGRTFAVSDIFSIGDIFCKDYKLLSSKKINKNDLPKDVIEAFEKAKGDYIVARPSYMAKHDVSDKKMSKIYNIAKKFLLHPKSKGFMKKGLTTTYYKNRKYSIENTRFSLLEFTLKKKKAFKYNRKLKNYYISLASQPDFNVPYIMFFPHYQPEASTSPAGDIFVNQRLCIEILLKHTPTNYFIYIKEHPNQFMSHMQGHTSRIREFYDDLVIHPRVKLMPFKIDSFTLIKNAKAISTVTGTVGWEASVKGKPVIIFGIVWYEHLSAVLRVKDENTAKKITSFIENYNYNESDILAYLAAFAKNTVSAYYYFGGKGKGQVNVSEEDSINNLTNEILRVINQNG